MDPIDKISSTNTQLIERIEKAEAEVERLTFALEKIALLDEAEGHELNDSHAFQAVAIATNTLGKHPSQIDSNKHYGKNK